MGNKIIIYADYLIELSIYQSSLEANVTQNKKLYKVVYEM